MKGHVTTRGYVAKKDDVHDHDSAVVATLRAAGAVFFCRTTMPQTGMALETTSNLWGRTLNPFNTKLVAGGSSGGDGALVAMKGCPIAPSSDIGGSIRIPAAFNGLYAMRPTSLRVPKGGWGGTKTGQISIRDSAGPVCHSIEDVRMFTKVLTSDASNRYDVSAVPVSWRDVALPREKLVVGVMKWDGVVMPQPPVLRAIEHTKQALCGSGLEGIVLLSPSLLVMDPKHECSYRISTTIRLLGARKMHGRRHCFQWTQKPRWLTICLVFYILSRWR